MTSSAPSTPAPSSLERALNGYHQQTDGVEAAMRSLVRPGAGQLPVAETLAVALGVPGAQLLELRSAPGGRHAAQILALRYLIKNAPVWLRYFAWERPLAKLDPRAVPKVAALMERLDRLASDGDATCRQALLTGPFSDVAHLCRDPLADEALRTLLIIDRDEQVQSVLASRFRCEGPELFESEPAAVDLVSLLAQDLRFFPATTVGAGDLAYIIVADKGEMGVRAVHEALEFGATPVVLYSQVDDDGALQVRLAQENGGFAIPLMGTFRETYANPIQIAEKVIAAYRDRFGDDARRELERSALYPGYGPLAENTAAIEVFRRNGIAFIGPMQDVVERAGDKRKFRLLAESIDPGAVTPGIVMNDSEASVIVAAIEQGARDHKFVFPGRLKAANGGGGRGQVVIDSLQGVPAAVTKVLSEIRANGWDPGVMFEQNILKTTHLEVQIVRDRFGNTRHFGMRDCTEQRASQKIQEEAPPAVLRQQPELERRMCAIAVQIADKVGYVGACTVELMYKSGHFYLLEMNTRIQVEHPVTEEAHRIMVGKELVPLNLVQLQFRVAAGHALNFAQDDVVQTHVAREFRINAESYKPTLKDPRDGKLGLFLPNAGVFDEIRVPEADEIRDALSEQGVTGVKELAVRFDCGFEPGDDLVNKDPTFGKLIVSVEPDDDAWDRAFELLRIASILVIQRTVIRGRQLTPSGKVLEDRPLETNLSGHQYVLETEMLRRHSQGGAPQRHVNWLIEQLRADPELAHGT